MAPSRVRRIAPGLLGSAYRTNVSSIRLWTCQTTTLNDVDLEFGHILPSSVSGREVSLQAAGDESHRLRDSLVVRSQRTGAEVVLQTTHAPSSGESPLSGARTKRRSVTH